MHRTTQPAVARLRRVVDEAMTYENRAQLWPSVAARLYPLPMRASATRLETFAACPFKHFAQHALRLEPREEQVVTHLDLGLVYHRVLDRLVRRAIREHRELAEPIPDVAAQIDALGHEAARDLRNELLLTPGRNAHLLDGVRRTLADVVESQRRTLALGEFRPSRTEFAFGFDGPDAAPPLRITTPAGRVVELRGKIDRIDTLRQVGEAGDRLAAVVIDYKLGAQRPEFERIYYGLSLQLVTYLLVLAAMGEEIFDGIAALEPAAAFYVKLSRGIQLVEHPSDAPEPGEDKFFLRAETKARGIIDERYAPALDESLAPGKWSDAYSIRKASSPVALRSHDVLEPGVFRALVEWSRTKVGELVDEIVDGRIEVRPYRLRTLTPCSSCGFRPVCRLDLRFNGYKSIRPDGDGTLRAIADVDAATAQAARRDAEGR